MLRVLVVADIRLFRDGIANFLRRQPRFAVAGTVASRRDAVAFCVSAPPHVALVDLALPESLDTIRDIVSRAPAVRVVALGVPDLPEVVIACAEAGVASFVPREGTLEDLAAALDSLQRDELCISPKLAASLLRHLGTLARGHQQAAREPTLLTAREAEVVALIGERLSNKAIAARLNIEIATVKNHVHNILEKLGVSRRGDVIISLRGHAAPSPAPDAHTAARSFG